MPTTDKELAKKQADVEKLRADVAAEEAKRIQFAIDSANDVTAHALDREVESLQAQLADLRAGNTKQAQEDGLAAVVDPEGTSAAQEQAKIDAGNEAGTLVDSSEVDAGAADEGKTTKRKGGNS